MGNLDLSEVNEKYFIIGIQVKQFQYMSHLTSLP